MSLRNLGLLTVFLALGAATAWWFTLRENQVARIAQLTSDLQTAQASALMRQQNEAEAARNLPEVTSALANLRAEMEAVETRIPNDVDFTPLMLLINNLTDKHLLQHDGITEQNREQLTPEMYVITYTLNTTGTFNDQMNFITDIHNQERLMIIEAINLTSRTGATPNEPMITLTLTLHTYARGTLPTELEEQE